MPANASRRVGRTEPRDAEVEDLHDAARRQHDVGRLEIAVQHAVRVGDGERVGDLHGDGDRLPFAQRSLGEAGRQGLAFDELEDDGHAAVVFDDVVDRGDGGVREGGGGARLVKQLRAAAGGAGLSGRHRLQRHLAPEAGVLGEQHGAHPAPPEFAEDPVGADGRVVHRGTPRVRERDAGPGDTTGVRSHAPDARIDYCIEPLAAARALVIAATV